MMTNEERLELIKKRIKMPVPNYLVEDFHWLVDQAERVQELEKTLAFMEKQRAQMGKSHGETIEGAGYLLLQNQRYKQALEDAKKYAKSPKILTEPAKIIGIIDRTLEESK